MTDPKRYSADQMLITAKAQMDFGFPNTALMLEQAAQTEAKVMGLVGELNLLIVGYVRTLDFARDKIISLGGKCDPIEVMEAQDPHIRRAREALSKFRGES